MSGERRLQFEIVNSAEAGLSVWTNDGCSACTPGKKESNGDDDCCCATLPVAAAAAAVAGPAPVASWMRPLTMREAEDPDPTPNARVLAPAPTGDTLRDRLLPRCLLRHVRPPHRIDPFAGPAQCPANHELPWPWSVESLEQVGEAGRTHSQD
jgi:hypothetical protein